MGTFSDNIRELYLNKKFNRFEFMGRARDFNRYTTQLKYGEFVHTVKRVKIMDKSLKRFIYNSKRTGRQLLELPMTSNCKVVGVWNGQYKRRKDNHNFKPDYTARECFKLAHEDYKKYDDSRVVRILPGAWRYNNRNLYDMATPTKVKYTTKDLIDGVMSRANIDLVLPKIPYYGPELINNVKVNHSSQPGINTCWLIGHKRSLTTPFTKPIAYQYARDIIMKPRSRYVLDSSLWHVGGREKRVNGKYTEHKKYLKSRCILAQEDVPTLIGQSVVVLVNESLQRISEGFNWGGRINGRGYFLDFVKKLTPGVNMTNFATDFTGHDNHVNEEEIVVAMGLLRCCFPEGDSIDRIFYYITSSMVFKRIVSPESNIIYELSKGLPSGHSFTSIMTTLTAYLKISTAIHKVIGNQTEINKTYLQGAGDDWNGLLHVKYLKLVSDHINKHSGATCDPFDENADSILADRESGKPTFLKKNYKHGLIAWNAVELYNNFAYPTYKITNIKRYLENLTVMCVSGPFDYRLNMVMQNVGIVKYFEHLIHTYSILNNKQYVAHKMDKFKMLETVISLAGPRFMRKIDLDHPVFLKSNVYDPVSNVYAGYMDISSDLKYFVNDFNKRVSASHRYMLAARIHQKFETLVRLRVFDGKKKYYANHDLHMSHSKYNRYYLSYR